MKKLTIVLVTSLIFVTACDTIDKNKEDIKKISGDALHEAVNDLIDKY